MILPIFFSRNQEYELENKLVAYNDSTSTQITVVTVASLDGADPNMYAYEIGEKWGVGQKDLITGIVILIAPNDRKTAIQVGYGIEAEVPDAWSKRIIDATLLPAFRQGDYYKGTSMLRIFCFSCLRERTSPSREEGLPSWAIILISIYHCHLLSSSAMR